MGKQTVWHNKAMERERAIAILRDHERELRQLGVEGASLFGSVARGETPAHDVDVAVQLGRNFSKPGLAFFGHLEQLEGRLAEILDSKVDVVVEPAGKPRLQGEIDKDRAIAF